MKPSRGGHARASGLYARACPLAASSGNRCVTVACRKMWFFRDFQHVKRTLIMASPSGGNCLVCGVRNSNMRCRYSASRRGDSMPWKLRHQTRTTTATGETKGASLVSENMTAPAASSLGPRPVSRSTRYLLRAILQPPHRSNAARQLDHPKPEAHQVHSVVLCAVAVTRYGVQLSLAPSTLRITTGSAYL